MGLLEQASALASKADAQIQSAGAKAFGLAKSLGDGTLATSDGNTQTSQSGRGEYLLHITRPKSHGRPAIDIVASLPEQLGINLQATWSAPFAEGLVNNDKINMATQLMGMKWSNQAMSSNFWTGGQEIEFSLPIVFTAENSYSDVLTPLQLLVELAVPTVNEMGFFRAPGPSLVAAGQLGDVAKSLYSLKSTATTTLDNTNTTNPDSRPATAGEVAAQSQSIFTGVRDKLSALMKFEGKISLTIGTFMHLDSVVITNINQDFVMMMGRDGVPNRVTCDVGFKLHQTPSAEDIKAWYIMGSSLDTYYQGMNNLGPDP